jgi:hypothetical protein
VAVSTRLRDDRGDVVVGWLTKLMVIITLVGLILIDGVSVIKAHYGASGDADIAASRASTAYALRHNSADAYAAAVEFAVDNDELIDRHQFHVNGKTGTVTLTLTRTADTVVLDRIAPLRRFGVASGSGAAGPPAPPAPGQ